MSESKMHPIVSRMMADDNMSQWLGIEVLESAPGVCRCRLQVRKDMVNGFGIAHGAVTYALADSTLAFAVNAKGKHAVSVTSTIQHLAPVMLGDTLVSEAIPRGEGQRGGIGGGPCGANGTGGGVHGPGGLGDGAGAPRNDAGAGGSCT